MTTPRLLLDPEQRQFVERLLHEAARIPVPSSGTARDHEQATTRLSLLAEAGARELWEWRGIAIGWPIPAPLDHDLLAALPESRARDQRLLRETLGWLEDALGAACHKVDAASVGADLARLAVIAHCYASVVFWRDALQSSNVS